MSCVRNCKYVEIGKSEGSLFCDNIHIDTTSTSVLKACFLPEQNVSKSSWMSPALSTSRPWTEIIFFTSSSFYTNSARFMELCCFCEPTRKSDFLIWLMEQTMTDGKQTSESGPVVVAIVVTSKDEFSSDCTFKTFLT